MSKRFKNQTEEFDELAALEWVYPSDIKIGEIIKCYDGNYRTVGKNDVKKCNFMGWLIFGDNIHMFKTKGLICRVKLNSAGCVIYK